MEVHQWVSDECLGDVGGAVWGSAGGGGFRLQTWSGISKLHANHG
jgi:hypothetical protein